MKKTILCFSILMSCLSLHAQKKPMNEFVDDLMAKMTVEEKIGQLNLMPGTDLTTGAKTNSPLVELVEADRCHRFGLAGKELCTILCECPPLRHRGT